MVRLLPLTATAAYSLSALGLPDFCSPRGVLRPLPNLGLEIKYVYVKESEEARSLPKTELAGLFWVSVAMADTQRYVFMN